jgi:AraC-like DNA-binding protein
MIWSTTLNLVKSADWHEHDILEFIFCRSGSGLLVVGRHDIELTPRRAVIIAPRARHRFLFRENESAELKIVCMTQTDATINLSAAQTAVLTQVKTTGAAFTDYAEQDGWLWELVDQIPDTLEGQEHGDPVMVWGVIGLLVASHLRRMDMLPGEAGVRHSDKIREICAWIDANLDQSEKLDDLALRFGMSRTLLTREFRKYTGASIVSYVNSRRLQSAGTALMSPGKSILEVSLEYGFASLANFYKQFKSLYGMTPAEFRNHLTDNFSARTA